MEGLTVSVFFTCSENIPGERRPQLEFGLVGFDLLMQTLPDSATRRSD